MDHAFFANVPLFVSFSPQEQEALSENFILREFNRGDHLFKQGEFANAMFLIQSGDVSLINRDAQNQQQVVKCGAQTLLGDVDLLLNQPYQKTAIAEEVVEAWILTRSEMIHMIRAWPEIKPKLSAVLGQPIALNTRTERQTEPHIIGENNKSQNEIDLSIFPLFANLTRKQQNDVSKQAQLESISANDIIFKRGAFPDLFYLLIKGQVKLINEHGHSNIVRQGGFFGEMSLLTGQPRQMTAQAVEECELLLLNRQQFETVTKQYPVISFVLNRTLSARLLRANALMHSNQALLAQMNQIQAHQNKEKQSAAPSKFWSRFKMSLFIIPLMWLAGIVAPTLLLNNGFNSDSTTPQDTMQVEITPTPSPTPTPDATSKGYYDS